MNKGLYALSMLIFFQDVTAFIYEVRGVRRWIPEKQRYHYFIGKSDFHDKSHPANEEQRKCIEKLLAAHDPRRIYVAVEDLSHSKNNVLIAGSFYINSNTGILANLATFCKHHGIPFSNIEYRYCRVAALGPIINNLQADPMLFPSARKVTIGMLAQEIEDAIKEITPLNATFNALLQERVRVIRQAMKKMQFDVKNTMSVAQYVTNSTALTRLELIKKMLTFDGQLVGFALAHAVCTHQEVEKVIAFAGGTHIAEACEILQRIYGYEPIVNTEVSVFKERDLQKCLGSNIVEGGYCIKPHPISVELIEHYLKN